MKDDTKHIINEVKVELNECLKEERQISDGRYAPILVATIVFGLVGLICVAVVTALISLIIK